jgi:hypothetical protein
MMDKRGFFDALLLAWLCLSLAVFLILPFVRPPYVLMSASDAFQHPTTRMHEMWQTDFTYFRIIN